MSVKKFELLTVNNLSQDGSLAIGTVVYDCHQCDYGCANDDTRHTGIEHGSYTLDPDGGYPFFTHPRNQLKEIKE